MAVYHRTRRLQIVGDKPEVTTLFGDRYQMIVNCQAARDTEAWYNSNKDQIFADFGTLYDAQMSIDGIGPRTGEAYDDMVLVSNAAGYGRGGEYVITFVYQTLTNAFVQEAADKVDHELNGLRRVTRSLIAKDGASYGKTVGTSTISHTEHGYTTKTLTLASAVEDAKQANEGGYVRIVETWVEAGTLSRNISTRKKGKLIIETVEAFNETPTADTSGAVKIGEQVSNVEGIPTNRFTFAKGEGEIRTSTRPGRIDGTKEVTVVSNGTEVVPTGVLINRTETQEDGYSQFTNTCIQGTIEGTKTTYKDVVQVEVPGEVNCTTISVSSGGESGTIAVPKVTPRRRRTIAAQVTIEVQTTPPNTASVAFDLGSISCSVTSTNVSLTRGAGNTISVVSGTNTNSQTGYVQNFSASARIQTYPGCFLTSSSSGGSINYTTSATPRADGNTIVTDETASSRTTKCEGTGSTSAEGYSTTGIIKRNSRPIITALDGTTYYEVITWSV